jgi:SAM-dependent methyltransferase
MVPLELAGQLFDKVGPRYKLCFYRHLAAYEFALSQLRPEDRVLDLGCGTGYGTAILAERCAEVTGVDYSTEAVGYAAEHYGSPKCTFREGNALNTGLPDGSVDAVCSVQVIEHIEDQEGFVKEVLRVLAPGGRFVVATPNKATYSPDADVGFAYHHKEYRGQELADFLSRHFSSVRLYGLFAKSVLARVYHDKDLSRYGRGRLLGVMPRFVRKKVRKLLWHRHKSSEISTGDFLVTDDMPVDDSLDLVAVCRKET